MGKQDVSRYFDEEVPQMGVIGNNPAALVCFASDCDERIEVDPETLVPEPREAVEVNPYAPDGERTNDIHVYCSPECRNRNYSHGVELEGEDAGE